MGMVDTIRNFFSGKKTKKKVSKEAVENALKRFARVNGLKYHPGMLESEMSRPFFRASKTASKHLSRKMPADSLVSARLRLKTIDHVMEQAKKTGDQEVTGVVLEEFGQILKDILAKMVEKEKGASSAKVAGMFANLVDNAAPNLSAARLPLEQVKAAVHEMKKSPSAPMFGPAPRPASFRTPKAKSASFHTALSKLPSAPMFGPAPRPGSFQTPKGSPSIHDQVRALMKKKDIAPSLLEALANWLQMEDTNRTRAEQAAANAERTKELREKAAKALAIPRKAIQVTRKAVAHKVRGIGDWWRRGTKVVRNAFGYKGTTPPPNVWSEPNVDVKIHVHLTDENENGQAYDFEVRANTSNRVEDLVAKISEQHWSENMDVSFNGLKLQQHNPIYYYGIADGAHVNAVVPQRWRDDN